ncbi:chemotaxis protein CheW [Egbenema bharatensis]|uniref:chemotaxis protein CheW n=1 Tax=Egbenema bharatensis TaxID=3463334 RepID=UPI003A8A759C
MSPSYRSIIRRNHATQQLIVFPLRQERFALPIRYAYKVIPMSQTYGVCQQTGVSLTRYQNCDVLVIDIQRRIFASAPIQPLLPGELNSVSHLESFQSPLISPNPTHLLLMQTPHNELMGIPLDTPPMLRRVPDSAFAPVPAAYLKQGNIRCISALVVPSKDEPPIFLLNPNQIIQSLSLLPEMEG